MNSKTTPSKNKPTSFQQKLDFYSPMGKILYQIIVDKSSVILQGLLLCLILFSQSCNTTKYLQWDEYLLEENNVIIKAKVDDKSDLKYELSTFYQQRPNTNYFRFIPRERVYYKALEREKDTKFQKWWRKYYEEKPSIYSDSLTTISALNMQKYLRYKGYLNATVIPQRDPKKKKMQVSYYALPGERYYIDTVSFHSIDPSIKSILKKAEKESFFKTGAPLDLSLFNQEKQRVTKLLKNHGNAEFYSTYISDLEVDTFQVHQKANLYINIVVPFGDSVHQKYYIGDIDIYLDHALDQKNIVQDTSIAGLHFHLSERGFIVSSATLRRAISLRPGELFKQNALDRTDNELSELGIFRFVRIKQIPDSIVKDLIHFNIQLTPGYKMEFSANLDVNYTNRAQPDTDNKKRSKHLLGISIGPNFRNRNLLGGAELFTSSLSAGLEIAPTEIGNRAFWNTIDLGADFSFSLPKFVDYLGIWRKIYNTNLNKKNRVISKPFYFGMRQQANTRIKASYNYVEIIDWNRYNLISIAYGFDYQPNRQTRFSVNHFALNFFDPTSEPAFDTILMNNGFLQRSFGAQVFVSLLFRELSFTKQSRSSSRGRSFYSSTSIETAGAEIFGINELMNLFSKKPIDLLTLRDNVEISQYIRFDTDFRYLKHLPNNQALATRFNIGIARPFGHRTSDVPFVKQFSVGGSNSMRAWSPRELGPGGYQFQDELESNSSLFQTGDFKMELNTEYRFPVLGFVHMALFIDAGNIWTIKQDDERPGSQILFKKGSPGKYIDNPAFIHYPFYKQIAVNSGIGLRLDLSFFIFRFDVGLKLRNSFPDTREGNPQESAWWNEPKDLGRDEFGLNFGLGFPF